MAVATGSKPFCLSSEFAYLAASDLFNKISSATGMVLIDVRSKESYDRMHIRTAINIDWASFFQHLSTSDSEPDESHTISYAESKMSSSVKSRFRLRRHFDVVVYGGNQLSDTQDEGSELVFSFCKALKNEGLVTKSLFVLQGGFASFVESKSFLVEGHPTCPDVQFIYPSEIIEDFLYLGSYDSASTHQCLTDLGVTHIVNVTDDCDCPYQAEFQYLQCPVDDYPYSDISVYFDVATEFIKTAKGIDESANNGCVLVHCKMGMSRSSTIVIAYLMKARNWSLKKAYHFVKSKRPFINPNYGFLKYLQNCEECIFGTTTISFPDSSQPSSYKWIDDE